MHISDNIKIVRALLKESQDDFRKRFTDITVGKQKSYEQGAANPGYLYVSEIADLAGVSEEDFRNKKLAKDDIRLKALANYGDKKDKNVFRGTSVKQDVTDKDLPAKAIYNLTESSKDLSEANRILADNESRLISLLETTVGSQKGNPAVAAASVSDLLEWIAEVGSGKKWGSKQEALAELHSFVYGKKKNIG